MPETPTNPWLRRVGWLVLLWIASVAALGLFAFALRGLMLAAGLRE